MKKTKKSNKKTVNSRKKSLKVKFKGLLSSMGKKRNDFLARRPHRSFQRTRRRDYVRSMSLPGYFALTAQVVNLLLNNKRIFFGIILIYAALTILSASIMPESSYQELRSIVGEVSEEGQFKEIVPIIGLFWGVFASQVTGVSFGTPGSAQQAIGVMLAMFAWLSTVWLTRAVMSGEKPRIRDGIYASGGPVIALALLMLVLVIQLIPAAVALIAYTSANATGILDQTGVLMLFGGGSILLITLSLYWLVSTLMAMIIVTLPGMYPGKALKLAGDLVVGRRTRIVLRVLWMILGILLMWVAVLVPVILIDQSLKSAFPIIEWLPLVPAVAMLLMASSIVLSGMYVYVFYRKVIADETPPA